MKKLILLSDVWNNDKNFVGSELELISKYYDVTVIANEPETNIDSSFTKGVTYKFYKRSTDILSVSKSALKCVIDKETWKEFFRVLKEKNKLAKISEVIRFYINAELFWSYVKGDLDILTANMEDVVVVYSYWYFFKCFAFVKHRTEYPNMRIITRAHEYDLFTISIPSGYQPYKYAMDEKLDKIIFIAEQGREYYLNKYIYRDKFPYGKMGENKGDCDKYVVYHLGTKDYQALNPYKKGSTFNLVSCSSVIPRKRVHLIVEALSKIDDIRIHWVHFGDGENFEELKALAKEKIDDIMVTKRSSNITYELKGFTNHDSVMAYYMENSIDAFAMVAVSEGNPVSVMEAMSFGIPIISYDISNMKNMMGNSGILISEDEGINGLKEAIRRLALSDSDTVEKYRDESYKIWGNNYRGDVNEKKFVNEILLQDIENFYN